MIGNEFIKMLGGSAFVLSCRLAGAIFAFATQIMLARWMGATELGIYVLAFSACILLATVLGLGYPNAALRIIGAALSKNAPDIISGFLRSSIQTILLVGVIVAAIGTTFFFTTDLVTTPYLIAFYCVPAFALMRLQSGVAHAHSWFPLSYLPNNVIRPGLLLAMLAGCWLLNVDLDASTVIAIHFLIIVMVAATQQFFLDRRLKPALSSVTPRFERATWTRISMPMMITVVMNAYLPELSVMMMGMYVETDQVAIFNASFRIAILISFLVMSVDGIVMPRVARFHADGDIDALQRIVSRATLIKVIGSVCAVTLLFAFGEQLLRLFGDEFVAGYSTMIILALAQVVIALMGAGAGILSVTGHQDSCLKVFSYALLLLLALNIVLLPIFGMRGAAITILSVVIARHVWLNILVARKVGVRPSVLATRNAFPLRDAESAA